MINTAPAVVVRAGLNGLGVVRSLARGAVPTIVVDTTRFRPAMWSRFGSATIVDTLEGKSLVDKLVALQKKIGGQPALLLTDKADVKIISEHRDELRGAYRFQLPPHDIVTMLESKPRFYEFAKQHELPVPCTLIVRNDTPLEKLSDLQYPVMVKPSRQPSDNPDAEGFRIYTLKDAEALCKQLLETDDELVVEEWIDGPDSNICFALFHRGLEPDSLKIFAGRDIASRLASNGNAALCLAAPEVMDSLEPLVTRLLEATEYQGLGGLEFKWDGRQRRYVIVGVTVGRTDWHEEIATLSGVNLPLAAYRHQLGMQPLHQVEIDRTVAWRESAMRGNGLSMLSPNMHVYDGYWRSNDPLPAVFFYSHVGLDWIYRHVGKPIIALLKIGQKHPAVEKTYQSLVKPILNRGKASASQ